MMDSTSVIGLPKMCPFKYSKYKEMNLLGRSMYPTENQLENVFNYCSI